MSKKILDEFDKIAWKEIINRKETRDSYQNTFNKITKVEVSETEARKELKGIENYLEAKQDWAVDVIEDVPNYNESTEITASGEYKSDKLLRMSKEESKDVDFLLEAHGFSTGVWELVSVRNNIWNVYSKQDGVQQLYSSKITVKPIIQEFNEEWIQNVVSNVNYTKSKLSKVKHDVDNSGKTVEINFCDVHIGKYITAMVAMGNYNADLAVEKFKKALSKAIASTKHYNIKKFTFVIGQDYINFDNLQGTTTKGTRQDMNEFYQTVYEKAYELAIESVELLKQIAPVDVMYVKGNHDKMSTYTILYGLHQLYKNDECVSVDYSLRQRKYRVYGDTLVGYGHGEEEKSRIFDCMQSDEKHNWGKTYKYFHLSHKHSESRKEKAGVIYNWLGALSESCKWTWESGFVGAEKKGHVFVYDDIDGKIAEFFIKV